MPFTKGNVDSFQLNNEALALVLCQLRWPSLANLQNDSQLEALLPALNDRMVSDGYLVYSKTKNINYTVTPEGITPSEDGTIHQWSTADGKWHISLSIQFLSLFSTQYSNYQELDSRLRAVVGIIDEIMKVPVVNRVGVRYVNRLTLPQDIARLASMIKPEVLGYGALELPYLQSSMNQASYQIDTDVLQVRSGLLGPNQSPDPSIEPVAGESWVLDIDASRITSQIMNIDSIMNIVSNLSDIDYDFFKSISTEEFVNRFSDKEGGLEH